MTKKEIFISTLPVMAGYIPLGLTYGIYGVSMGLAVWVMSLSAMLIYAGSVEFILVSFIITQASLVDTFLIAFLLNFRHFFYTMALLPQIKALKNKFYFIYALTDETFALLISKNFTPNDDKNMIFNLTAIFNQSYWVAGTTLGAILGASVDFDFSGVEFALLALFVVLSYEMYRKNPQKSVILIALICSLVGFLFFDKNYFLFGTIMLGIALLLAFKRQIS